MKEYTYDSGVEGRRRPVHRKRSGKPVCGRDSDPSDLADIALCGVVRRDAGHNDARPTGITERLLFTKAEIERIVAAYGPFPRGFRHVRLDAGKVLVLCIVAPAGEEGNVVRHRRVIPGIGEF